LRRCLKEKVDAGWATDNRLWTMGHGISSYGLRPGAIIINSKMCKNTTQVTQI